MDQGSRLSEKGAAEVHEESTERQPLNMINQSLISDGNGRNQKRNSSHQQFASASIQENNEKMKRRKRQQNAMSQVPEALLKQPNTTLILNI